MLVGTRDANLVPDAVRGVGVRVWPGGSQMTAYVPAATGARAVANARATQQIAVTLSLPATHRTIQIKGTVREVRDAREDERAVILGWREGFVACLAVIGLLPDVTGRLTCWPARAVDVDIGEVFAQTPGPDAGCRIPRP